MGRKMGWGEGSSWWFGGKEEWSGDSGESEDVVVESDAPADPKLVVGQSILLLRK